MLISFLIRLNKFLQKIINYLVILLFTIIVIVVNLQIFFRYVLRQPLFWSMEVAQLAFIYLAIFGGGLALINNEFTKVEFFVNLISKSVRKILEILGHILILIFLIIAGYKSEELIYQAKITVNVTPALVIPMDYIYRILQIGFYIFAFFAITKVLILIFEKKIKGA